MFSYNKIKKYNISIIIVIIISVIATILINYATDPFDVFHTKKIKRFNVLKPCKSKQERLTLIPKIKTQKENIDIIFVGSSKTDWWLDTNFHSKVSEKKVESMSLSSSSLQEDIIMAKNGIFLHPEIKKVFFGLDFFAFSKEYFDTAIDVQEVTTNKITKEEVLPLLISLDTLSYSFSTITGNLKYKEPSVNIAATEAVAPEKNPKALHYFQQTIKKYKRDYYKIFNLNTDAFTKLEEFTEFAQKHNVEVIYFITPSHITDLINIYNNNLWDEYQRFRTVLSEYFNYYDLSSINEYNTEDVSEDLKYFRDPVHATKYYGQIIAKDFYLNKNTSAVKITKNNINKYIMDEDKKLNDYVNSHPEIVKQVEIWSK